MVMKLKKFLTTLWADDTGQSTTEYILMLSVVVMVAMKFKSTFLGKIQPIVDRLGSDIQSAASTEGQ